MAFTVQDLLELPILTRARPEVATGEDLVPSRPVRWVHTSEIYDIAPLLRGGEALLTTGLGLVAASPAARREYVRALARVGVSALLLELGRTFPTVPREVVEEAVRVRLPLVLLHSVVPFSEVTEAAHAVLLGGELEHLRAVSRVREQLTRALAETSGVVAFTGVISEVAGCPASLYSRSGELVAGTAPVGDAGEAAEVMVTGDTWGRLVLAAPPGEHVRAVLEAAAPLVALEVSRAGASPLSRHLAGAELLRDMVTGRYASTAELTSRAIGVGMSARPADRLVALCIRRRSPTGSAAGVLPAAREIAGRVLGASIAADVDGDVLVAASTRMREVGTALDHFADELAAELRSTRSDPVLVSAGPVVADVPGLVGALTGARQTAALAQRLTPSARVVLAEDFALYRLLVSLVGDEALERFVVDQLGPLLEHDARTRAGLVMTLDTYLGTGMSKTRAAEILGIRRQTLYGRLDRIRALLGGLDLDNRERRTALEVALVSWRLRVSAAVRG